MVVILQCALKLVKETYIVLEQQADVADFIPGSGKTVQADTESKAAVLVGVNAAI